MTLRSHRGAFDEEVCRENLQSCNVLIFRQIQKMSKDVLFAINLLLVRNDGILVRGNVRIFRHPPCIALVALTGASLSLSDER